MKHLSKLRSRHIFVLKKTKKKVLAAANPIGVHYDKTKTVAANLNISGPLLSRFDLLFILLDTPNKELDARITKHIMDLHAKGDGNASASGGAANSKYNDASMLLKTSTIPKVSRVSAVSMPPPSSASASTCNNDTTTNASTDDLVRMLRLEPNESFEVIPFPLFRKYISYARRTCNPRIGDEAADALAEFYTELRQRNLRSNGCNPVTMRQLESLARLTQARAKCELRNECTREDAYEVIEIMKSSMVDYYENELGLLDMTASGFDMGSQMSVGVGGGGGGSRISQIKNFATQLEKYAIDRKNPVFTVPELKFLYDVSDFKEL